MHDLLVSNEQYSEIGANLSYGYFLQPDYPDKGGSTVYMYIPTLLKIPLITFCY